MSLWTLPPCLKKATDSKLVSAVGGVSQHESLKRLLQKAVKVKPQDPKMSKMSELDISQGEMLTESGTREGEVSAVSKAEHHLSSLTLDIEIQNLEFICWRMDGIALFLFCSNIFSLCPHSSLLYSNIDSGSLGVRSISFGF